MTPEQRDRKRKADRERMRQIKAEVNEAPGIHMRGIYDLFMCGVPMQTLRHYFGSDRVADLGIEVIEEIIRRRGEQ